MTRLRETKELARAIRDHAMRNAVEHSRNLQKAIVLTVGPLTVELAAHDILVDEESLLLGAWPRLFDRLWGIAVGDTVLLEELDDGDWYLLDVVSQSDLEGGLLEDAFTMTVLSATWTGGTVIGTVPWRNPVTGAIVGVVPVFQSGSIH
jgi:hypothetical protein